MAAVEWLAQAACREATTKMFFWEHSEAKAKALCAECPVREDCLNYAIETEQIFGVWGGLNETERRNLRHRGIPVDRPLDFDLVTYTTRARSTGATCSAGRANGAWGTRCEDHNAYATNNNRTGAEYAVSRPEEWCPGCRQTADSRVG